MIPTDGYASNCYILTCGAHSAIVDPSAELKEITEAVKNSDSKVDYILLTHGHFDHMLTLDTLRGAIEAKVCIHIDDNEKLGSPQKSMFSLLGPYSKSFSEAECKLNDGDTILLGEEEIKVIHTPGHTQGSVCYNCGDFILTGDTLFDMSVGRCDFPGGSIEELRNSIRKLYDLDLSAKIYPGHGNSSDLYTQKMFNPYTKDI